MPSHYALQYGIFTVKEEFMSKEKLVSNLNMHI